MRPLVEQMVLLFAGHPELVDVDALVLVPSSIQYATNPVRTLAEALGQRLARPVWPVLVKTRQTAP